MRTSRAVLFRSWHYMPIHEKNNYAQASELAPQNRFSRARIFMYLENCIRKKINSQIEIKDIRGECREERHELITTSKQTKQKNT